MFECTCSMCCYIVRVGGSCSYSVWIIIVEMIMSFISDLPLLVGPEGGNRHAVLVGGNITLVCASRVNGNPTPTISWMDNNGTTVSDGTGISGSTTLSLTISSVTRYQAGNWTCTAENSPGGTLRTAERQIILTVVGECVCDYLLSIYIIAN